MNKKFLMLAAATTMFAACSNEMDPVSSPDVAQNNAEVSAQTPVLFDAYSGRALTRAGAEGALDNAALATNGFGVFGYYTENELYNDTYKPTFMYNAKVSTTSWTYSPLKYWPNEFGGEAQSDDVDRLSFFAYAPYVHVDPSTGIPDGGQDATSGITAMTRNSSTGDPFVKYAVNFTDLTKQVDFSWGVAKTGAPTAVTGATQATVEAGSPFKDLVKPAADQKIGFEFNHALAQLNVQLDAKVDGADNVDINNTRIWVRSVTFEGFATKGMFNLNQSKVGAVWSDLSGNSISSSPVTIYDGRTDGKEGVSAASNEAPAALNEGIVQAGAYAVDTYNKITAPTATGVTKTAKNLFGGNDPAASLYVIPNQQDFKVTIEYDVETVDAKLPTYLADGVTKGSRVQNTISQIVKFGDATQLEAGKKYTLKLHLGMSTVKFDAQVSKWQDANPAGEEVMLPINKGSNEGGLNNSLFAVSATKNVHFTPGNLQWISTDANDATKGYWKIAESQYSFLGKYNPVPTATGTKLPVGSVDLFGWGEVEPSFLGSTENSDYQPSISGGNVNLTTDWATKFNSTGEDAATFYAAPNQPYQKPAGDGAYCVLTSAEWQYLFDNQYWGFATVKLTNGGTVNGIVVCPSSVDTEDAAKAFLTGTVYKSSADLYGITDAYNENKISKKTIDDNGLLFLPAAGRRAGSSIDDVGSIGYYWSTTSSSATAAYSMHFGATHFSNPNSYGRRYGFSVRLASVAQ